MATTPQDHRPAKKTAAKKTTSTTPAARRAEARGETAPPEVVTFEHDDIEYRIERYRVDDLEVVEMVEDGKEITALKRVLGDEQWNAYKTAHRDPNTGIVSMSGAKTFFDALYEAVGAAGNR